MQDWLGEIQFSPAVDRKLRTKHGLTPQQVRNAIAWGRHEKAWWDNHERYCRRLIVIAGDAHGKVIAYLRPIDRADGIWQCLTAWRM